MATVKPIPDGYGTLTPHIVVKDGRKAIEFYKKAFGAEAGGVFDGPDGKFMHGEIKIGNSRMMLSPENPQWGATSPATLGGSSVTLALYVTDTDKSFKRAVDAGAKPVDAAGGHVLGRSLRRGGRSRRPQVVDRHAREGSDARRDAAGHAGHVQGLSTGARVVLEGLGRVRLSSSSR